MPAPDLRHSLVCPYTPSWAGPSLSLSCPVLFLAACLGLPHYLSMPPLPDTPATPSTAGTPHHLALIPAHLPLLEQKHLPAVFQIIDADSHLCKKCSCFDKERAVLEWLPEPPHHSWSFSGVSVTIQLGGPAHLLISVWRLKTLQFSSASQCIVPVSQEDTSWAL